jgi:hypothetical protein
MEFLNFLLILFTGCAVAAAGLSTGVQAAVVSCLLAVLLLLIARTAPSCRG